LKNTVQKLLKKLSGHLRRKKIITKLEALKLVKKDGFAIKSLNKNLKKDKEIVLAAVKNEAFAICYADKKFLRSKEVAKVALKNNIYVYLVLDKKLINDREIMTLAGLKKTYK
tara:strand:- start:618 stop:956 length:339 start_codon:yes stop_codon:yes gene_type:complete